MVTRSIPPAAGFAAPIGDDLPQSGRAAAPMLTRCAAFALAAVSVGLWGLVLIRSAVLLSAAPGAVAQPCVLLLEDGPPPALSSAGCAPRG